MAATKVWKKLRSVEKAGLIGLCAVMLLTLGIGGSTVFGSCDGSTAQAGTVTIDGKVVEIDLTAYNQFRRRHVGLLAGIGIAQTGRPLPVKSEDLDRTFLLHQLAQHAGMEVSDNELRRILQEVLFVNRETGQFDKTMYKRILERAKVPNETEFERALRERLEVDAYQSMFQNALGPTMEEIYAAFKARNQKYLVEYSWMPLASFEERVDPASFTTEELAEYFKTIEREYQVDTRRQVESAYVVHVDVTDEEFAAAYERFADLHVSFKDGYQYYRRNEDNFTFTAYEKIVAEPKEEEEPDDEEEKDAEDDDEPGEKDGADDDGDDGDDEDDDGEPGETPATDEEPVPGEVPAGEPPTTTEGEVPPTGVEPGEAEAPEPTPRDEYDRLNEQEKYETYWVDIIKKEMFYQRVARRLLAEMRESEEPLELEALAEKYGLRYLKTELLEPLEMQNVPEIGCEDLRFETIKYEDDRGDGKLLSRVLPTTNTSTEPRRRGWQVVRIVKVDPTHAKPLADVEEEVRKRYREKKLHDLAREEIEALGEAAGEEGATFASVLEEKGLPLRTLDAFNDKSARPQVTADDLESEDEEVRTKALERALDRFVMSRGLSDVRRGDVKFSNPLVDAMSKTVVLIHVLGKEDPIAQEMSQQDVRQIRRQLLSTEAGLLGGGPFSLESLKKRLDFVPPGHRDP